jgi:hypothetical protein
MLTIGTLIILAIGQMSLSQQCININFQLDILCHPPLPTQQANSIYSFIALSTRFTVNRINSTYNRLKPIGIVKASES